MQPFAAAQTTAAAEKSSSNKSYIVVSTLPHEYRLPEVMGAATIKYATYQGLVAFVVALIYLNGRSIGTKALDRYLRIMQANDNHMDKILQQMQKNGYIVKVRDSAGDTGDITQYDYHLGPRAKVEIGEDGLKRLVKSVFGDECPEDIDERIQRNIGVDMSNMTIADEAGGEGEDADDEIGATARKKAPASNTRRKQTRSRRTQDDDDDDY